MTLQNIIFTGSQLNASMICVLGSGLVRRDLAQQVLFLIFLINIELANPECVSLLNGIFTDGTIRW